MFLVRTIRNTQTRCVGRIYNNSVSTSQETQYVFATETNRLMLFGETVPVYCETHTDHINTRCEVNAEFLHANTGGAYGEHVA
jgi:hypothetical protein